MSLYSTRTSKSVKSEKFNVISYRFYLILCRKTKNFRDIYFILFNRLLFNKAEERLTILSTNVLYAGLCLITILRLGAIE